MLESSDEDDDEDNDQEWANDDAEEEPQVQPQFQPQVQLQGPGGEDEWVYPRSKKNQHYLVSFMRFPNDVLYDKNHQFTKQLSSHITSSDG